MALDGVGPSIARGSQPENGTSAELLSYDSMKFHTLAGAVGQRGSYDIPVSWGTLTPMARVECRQAFDGAFQQSMYYTDLGPSVTSVLPHVKAGKLKAVPSRSAHVERIMKISPWSFCGGTNLTSFVRWRQRRTRLGRRAA